MPIYYDMEDSSQTKYGKTALTKIAKAFCEAMKAGGYRAGVYANLYWFNNYLNYTELKKSYSIWLAQYNIINQHDCDIWQNSSTGNISGISGNVDTNIIYNSGVISGGTSASSTTATSTKTSAANTAKATMPDITYRVRAGGKWYSAVKNLTDFAGVIGKAITDVAIKVSKGNIKYRVHIKGGSWLPWVTGYNIADSKNGYAGNGKVIDAIEVYYTTPSDVVKSVGYLRAKYRVSPLNSGYYSYQYDSETGNGQDGYAGALGKSIDRLQITLAK